jgi:hypothetical protein
MERDLVQQAESFLQNTFQDKLTAEELASLENWLSVQLEKERQGWKKQLQMSMKEIEKERRLAMDVHECVQRLNVRIKDKMNARGLERTHSIYYGDDKDAKTSQIDTLEKNVGCILDTLEHNKQELRTALEYCNKEASGVSLLEAIQAKIHLYEQQVDYAMQASRETEEKLLSEIHNLNNNITHIHNTLHQDQKRHAQETLALQEIISMQKDKLENRVDAHRRIGMSDKEVQTNRREMGGTRECCIQVEVPQPFNSARMNPNPYIEQSDAGDYPQPITAIVLHQYESSTKHGTDPPDHTPATSSKSGKHIYSRYSNKYSKKEAANSEESKQAIEDLKKQVVGFAEKLEKAKREMEIYQHQMALIKASKSGSKSHTKEAGPGQKAATDCLCGVKKNILPSIDEVESPISPSQKLTKYTGKCLRCHKVYKIKDNHRLACNYHPKAKQTVEKYDTDGKLLRITYLWECCLQRSEAPGCCTGAHV